MTKYHNSKMTKYHNNKMTKNHNNKMTKYHNNKMTKFQINEIPLGSQNKMMKRQTDVRATSTQKTILRRN
jgi:hypothetical protein